MRRLSVVLCVVGSVVVAAPAFAQTTTGNIVGTVSDASGAVLPGVTATLTGKFAAGSFTSITNARGFYRFQRLQPGSYDVAFALDGFGQTTRTAVRVTLGGTTTENVSMSVGELAESVTVVADSVVVDTTDVGLSNTYDTQMVTNLPLRRDSVYDLMMSAPGVTTGTESGRVMVVGSEMDGNSYLLDGVSTTPLATGDTWTTPHTDIIAEVEAMTLGAPAEYGHAPGGVFNVVTRQGSNAFHGEASFYLRTDGMMGNNTDESYDNGHPASIDQWRDVAGQVGGPIMKDKLWFFAAIGDKIDNQAAAGIPADFAQVREHRTYFGKLNWQINPAHKLQVSMNYDDYTTERNASPLSHESRQKVFTGTTPAPSAAYTGLLSDSTMLEVRYGGFYGPRSSSPKNRERRDGPWYYNGVDGGDCSTGPCLYTGGSNYWYDLKESSTNITASLSHFADDFLGGSHDFKFGVQYKKGGRTEAVVGYTDYFSLYADENGDEYVYGTDYSPFGYGGVATNKAVFIDDVFRVNDRLTLRLGLRYNNDVASIPELDILASDATGASDEKIPAIDNLFDYNTIAPRLGFTYALTDDGKTIIRGHWGRYHRGMVTMDFAGGNGNIGTTNQQTFYGTYTPECFHAETCEGDGNGLDAGGRNDVGIDPNIQSGRTDQFNIGIERELATDVGLSVLYAHKRGSSFVAWHDSTGVYEQIEWTEPNSGITNTISRLTSDPEDRFYLLGNPDDFNTKINAVIVTLDKRMSNGWQGLASLTLLRSTGKLPSQYTQNGRNRARGGVAWTGYGKRPNHFVNVGGRTINDMPVVVKLQVMKELPANFLVAANYNYQAGGTWTLSGRTRDGNIGATETILLEERDGSRRFDARNALDLRLQWTARLGDSAGLSLFLDTFNVFNDDAALRVRSTRAGNARLGADNDIIQPRRLQVGARFTF